MRLYICVDDTDDLTKAISTGKVAEYLADHVRKLGGTASGITRHQLLLHPDIPYTSHNSSMAFSAELPAELEKTMIKDLEDIIVKYSEDNADPGLSVCNLDNLKNMDLLIDYGYQGKKLVLTKKQAYDMAEKCGVYLVELGGTGQGVIGALAGIGLRLGGMDGTFRGNFPIDAGRYTAKELAEKVGVAYVCTSDKAKVADDIIVTVDGKVKPSYWNHKQVLVVMQDENGDYIHKSRRQFSSLKDDLVENCEDFVPDNDPNEFVSDSLVSCLNCLYRRNTAEGIECVFKES